MFTNIRKIDEIQGKGNLYNWWKVYEVFKRISLPLTEHKMGEKEISRKEFEQIQRLVDTREGTFIY